MLAASRTAASGLFVCPTDLSLNLHCPRRGTVRLGFVSAGGFFGEVPMLDHTATAEVRERTVTAVTDCSLIYIDAEDIDRLKKRYPELALRLKQCSRVARYISKKEIKLQGAVAVSSLFNPAKFGGSRTKTAPNLTEHLAPR